MKYKRIWLLFLPLFFVMIAMSAVVVAESQRTPAWQSLLATYASSKGLDIGRVARAKLPRHFTEQLDTQVLDRSQFDYIADITYDGPASYSIVPAYPPETIYCAWLARGNRAELIFVSYHSDTLWQHGWVIHRSEAATEVVTLIGC